MFEKILLVEDDDVQREMTALLLKNRLAMEPVKASSARQALTLLAQDEERSIQLVLLDHMMPEMSGLELLALLSQQYPSLPVIMLTSTSDISVAVEAMRRGARDFLSKPPEPERLRVSINNALKLSVLEEEVVRLKRQQSGAFVFDNLIGHDGGLEAVVRTGRKAAGSDIPVLLLGETGVGKEVFAQAIHGESKRVGKPFVAVNCGAIPENLVESTLFGHEKGAFTGAVSKSVGRFREAEGGTIFLDEVGELPMDAQVKLLRVLQQKEVVPVGASKPVSVNVRVISATNRNLERDVAEKKFREDLYFRLNVLSLSLPPLRDRPHDIPALVHHFIKRFSAGERLTMKKVPDSVMTYLSTRPWPGNVRELENTIYRALVLCEGDTLRETDFIRDDIAPRSGTAQGQSSGGIASIDLYDSLSGRIKTMEAIEREAIDLTLSLMSGNITRAAQTLGIAKSTFYRKIGGDRSELKS